MGPESDPQQRPPTAVPDGQHPDYEVEFRTLGEILERDAEQIMEQWFERATEAHTHAEPAQREEAMNDLLTMLRSLGRRLKEQTGEAMEHAAKIAREHGRQRSTIGWNIVDVVNDYEILHGVVLEHLGRTLNERLTYRQAMIIATVIEKAVAASVQTFSEMAEQRLKDRVRQQKIELRQLTLDLTDAEHHERERIARQLHDDLQQMLVAIQMKLGIALKDSSAARLAVEQSAQLTKQTIAVARNLTADLYPKVLESDSLPAAIEELARTFQEQYDLTVSVDLQVSRDSNPGPLALRRLVYDAIRELLFNVVKHAETDHAWVNICCDEALPWSIEVSDRGKGGAELSAASAGFGLHAVRRRIEQIGGTMEVHTEPGQGTGIVLTVPAESE
ncbi:MAG: sensor histidine kinase [Phycisphaeraceae bacterium]